VNGSVPAPIPLSDLEQVLERSAPLWRALAGERLFVTGGTGFIGTWLLETFALARRRLSLDLRATVLTRDAGSFRTRAPRVGSCESIEWLAGDVRSFEKPPGRFALLIHAATDSRADFQRANPRAVAESIVSGTQRVLEFADAAGVRQFLYLSSGAVYGTQPPELSTLAEDYPGAPNSLDTGAVYGQSKRLAETLCVAAASATLSPTIARCFAFVGPLLPLDGHFAVGNFIRDAAAGNPIDVRSDGRAVRSYMHAVDLVVWLVTLLLHGTPGRAYNVGSDQPVSVGELATMVAHAAEPRVPVRIRDPHAPGPAPRYVPSIARVRTELGLELSIGLPEALRRTLAWARQTPGSTALPAPSHSAHG
jgi:dTDP-glucose 4,6-dehydratase